MYNFYYHICTIPVNSKYLVRKYIFDDNFLFINYDDYNFSYKNVNTLINKLDKVQYSKIDVSILDKVEKPTKEELIKSVVSNVMGDSGNGQITFENFLNGNFSYP